jgi:subtilisin family serine protease
MPGVWDKIDSGLVQIYTNYLNVRRYPKAVLPLPPVAEGGKVHVLLRYQGDLRRIEAAGFETFATDEQGTVSGVLHLEDLEAIATRDEVLNILYGTKPQPYLDVSVRQIKANKVWQQGPEPYYEFTGTTGAGVIVGIIDSGVDIHHPFLWRQSKPSKTTRILSIWDMGLVPEPGEKAPDVDLLDKLTLGTYGVEYCQNDINRVLRRVAGAMPIRHRDCLGHGTHVASIAAGDGRFEFKLRGVAPRADLVVVKLLHLATEPKVGSKYVNSVQLFRDAVTYILRVADKCKRPVVINCSMGDNMGPHDGLTTSEDWLSNRFGDAVSAGKIFVAAAGNDAGVARGTGKPKRRHAQIEFSRAGTVAIPFELFDDRETFSQSDGCVDASNTVTPGIHFYYPAGTAAITCEFKPMGNRTFSSGPALRPGLEGAKLTIPFAQKTRVANLIHMNEIDIIRNTLQVTVEPHPTMDDHLIGDYVVRLTASEAVTVHVWCYQSHNQGFRIKPPARPSAARFTVEDKFLINSPGCASNVITVAAYDPDEDAYPVAGFSSRGPVARHGVGGDPPAKPDIAAPGVKINAARSRDVNAPKAGVTMEKDGTSMAAPHVTGVVALMLQKNPSLTPSQVRTILQTHAVTDPVPVPEEVGAGRLNAKAAVTNTPKA